MRTEWVSLHGGESSEKGGFNYPVEPEAPVPQVSLRSDAHIGQARYAFDYGVDLTVRRQSIVRSPVL
jgi:hypothetical protein